jgi:hypothetical protein
MSLVDANFRIYIDNLISSNVLPNLNEKEYNIIIKMLVILIDYIACRFNFDLANAEQYIYQLKQNNNRDLYAIFNLLLPYIDDKGGSFELHKKIHDLKDITIAKDEKLTEGWKKPTDRGHNNISKNPYIISNLQFNRNIININYLTKFISSGKTIEDPPAEYFKFPDKDEYFHEYELSKLDLMCNFYILLNTVDQISNKLYVNWLNIRPITWSYKNSSLYKNTFNYDEDGKLTTVIAGEKHEFGWFNPILIDIDSIYHTQYKNTYNQTYSLLSYRGLSVGDFYNMIHHELYFSIKNFKWLIYEYADTGSNETNIYWNIIVDKFKNIDEYIMNDYDFEYIATRYSDIITQWTFMLSRLADPSEDELDIIYNILYFFQRKYSKIKSLESYVRLNINDGGDDDIALEQIDRDIEILYKDKEESPIGRDEIIKSWQSLNVKDFYNFIKETIIMFKKTWYGYNIITKKNKYPQLTDGSIILKNITHQVTYKNIYNWAKSLLIYVYSGEGDLTIVAENLAYYKDYYWHMLGDHDLFDNYKQLIKIKSEKLNKSLLMHHYNFCNAINMTNMPDNTKHWFNIRRVLKNKIYKHLPLSENSIKRLNTGINEAIRRNLTDIVFECLLNRGLLNEFVIDRECTDKSYLGSMFETITARRIAAAKRNIFTKDNIEKYKECIYYLTEEPYGKLIPRYEKGQSKGKSYFDYLPEAAWCTFYAMDWVSQINFYHRYINNRVIYVTGATGAGKSTQVPKLLLYGLKMINFKNDGKVVSTQPRTKPTQSNAKNISNEMGVPIVAYSPAVDDEMKTNLGYIQYKTAKVSHLQPDKYNYYFREMTDGSLVNELYKNALLKKVIRVNDDDTYDRNLEFKPENIYDIVVIDESHEHNKNMDYILTMMKYTTYWNNSLRLVIISATMDDDEPIYRRFYNGINDNFLYPNSIYNMTNHFHFDTLEGSDKHSTNCKLDRIVVDRRIHISPPGETTQHKIDEYYLSRNTKDYQDAETEAIDTVLRIVNSGGKGDLLLFSIGEAQIRKLVSILNERTPANVIALPLFSELNEFWSELAEKTEKIKDLTIDKSELFNEIAAKGSATKKVPLGTYNQVIVVATNVAEASITIKNLKYVIDTGYYNSVTYDNVSRSTLVTVAPITEASRLQRRGRVGRVSSGKVYHMYMKDARKNVMPSYNICNSNIRNDIYQMARERHDEQYLINVKYTQFIFPTILRNKTFQSYDMKEKLGRHTRDMIPLSLTYGTIKVDNNATAESIDKIMRKQNTYHRLQVYKSNTFADENILFTYSGELYFADYTFRHGSYLYNIHNRNITGYSFTSIIDMTGTFHLIHPAENLITTRHLLTGLIDYDQMNITDREKFVNKTFAYINNLISVKFIVPSIVRTHSYIANDDFSSILDHNESTTEIQHLKLPGKLVSYDAKINDHELHTIDGSRRIYHDVTNDYFDKTVFSKKAFYVYEKLNLTTIDLKDENIKLGCLIAIIYSVLYDVNIDVLKIVAGIFAFGPELKNFIPQHTVNGKSRYNLSKNPLDQFRDNDGDLFVYLNLFNKLESDLNLSLIRDKSQSTISNNDLHSFEHDRTKYFAIKERIYEKIKTNDKNPYDYSSSYDLSLQDYILLQNLDQKGILSDNATVDSRAYKDYMQDKTARLRSIIKTEEETINIIKWSMNRNVPHDKVKNMIRYYTDMQNRIALDKNLFTWFNKLNIDPDGSRNERIIKCFIHGFLENLAHYNNETDKLVDTYNDVNMKVASIYPGSKKTDTTIIPYKHILYLSKNNNGEPVNMNKASINMLLSIIPDIINPYTLQNNEPYVSIDELYVRNYFIDVHNNHDQRYIEKLAIHKDIDNDHKIEQLRRDLSSDTINKEDKRSIKKELEKLEKEEKNNLVNYYRDYINYIKSNKK